MKFQDQLAALGFESYEAYLASAGWANFRAKYRASGLPQRCLLCGTPHFDLHHTSYRRLGKELLEDVMPLCRKHHEDVHKWIADHGVSVEQTSQAISAIRAAMPLPPKIRDLGERAVAVTHKRSDRFQQKALQKIAAWVRDGDFQALIGYIAAVKGAKRSSRRRKKARPS